MAIICVMCVMAVMCVKQYTETSAKELKTVMNEISTSSTL